MTKLDVKLKLTNNHQAFVDYINSLTTEELLYAPVDKWTAAQQLDHIHKSVKPLTQGMGYPKFLLKWKFGKANRPSRTYDEVVKKYNSKLALGGKASSPFVPAITGVEKKEMLSTLILKSVQKLNNRLDRFSESEMDNMILPHPLLGKITIREMMYFTIYHVEQHKEIIKRELDKK